MIIRSLGCAFLLIAASAHAQIETDGSLGPAQSLSGLDYIINENLGKRAGDNLFHSFSEFNVNQGESATFTGSSDIANVISRVTGGKLSTIDGLLKSEIPNANLYLINPAGILFGPNASLSINGSFHASTADFIRLGDADLFYSEPLQSEILSTAAPKAFGFFGAPEGDIVLVGSQFDLAEKAALSLVGSEIIIEDEASIRIPQGQINLIGVNSEGEASWNTSFGYQDPDTSTFNAFNEVHISSKSELNVDGEGGGRVVIRGGRLTLRDSLISARTTEDQNGRGVNITSDRFNFVRSQVDTTTTGIGSAGGIQIDAKTLVFNGLGEFEQVGLFANSKDLGSLNIGQDAAALGTAGMITITAHQMDIRGDVAIETTATESAGIIDLSATEMTLDGFRANFQVNSGTVEFTRFTDSNIILDGSLHPDQNGEILDGPDYEITADMGSVVENNLFHSFRSFFLDEGETATFSGPGTISNIITRVTGDNATNIYGNLVSDIGEANFYFINPNGLFFGPNATLSLPGSFHIGTADYLTFQGGGRFDVSVPDESILSGSKLLTYGFKDNEIGEITIEGRLAVNSNKTLSLIGGNLQLQDNKSRVIANSGQVNLVSLQSEGEVFIENGNNDLDVSGFEALGDIAIVDDSAANVAALTLDSPVGRIFLRGNDLRLDNNGQLRARNFGENTGGSIDVSLSGDLFVGRDSKINMSGQGPLGQAYIEAENITIDGDRAVISITKEEPIHNDINPIVEISDSDINLRINAKGSLRVLNGGSIDTSTFAIGNAGSMAIWANDLTIDGQGAVFAGISSVTSFNAKGDGGNIDIQVTEQLKIINGGQVNVSTFSTLGGNGGKATIRARNLIINDGGKSTDDSIQTGILAVSSDNTKGISGEVDIYVDEQLQVLNGGLINTSTLGTGNAGSITIQTKNLTIDGQGSDFAGIGSIAAPQATGNGGNLDIQVAEQLEIIDGGQVNVSTFSTLGSNGGKAIIRAKNLIIDGQDFGFAGIRSVAALEATGNGGDLDVQVAEQLGIINGGNISASAETGNAGNLSISAGENIYIENSSLNISAGQVNLDTNNSDNFQRPELRIEAGNSIRIQNSDLSTNAGVLGGDIYLQAPIEIWLEGSTLLAQAGYVGGNVYIDPMRYIVISSDVIAQADFQGGNYSVIVTLPFGWIQSTDSLINLSGEQSGSVFSNVSPFDLGAELNDLDLDFLNVEAWVSQPCKFRLGGTGSSFIVTGWKGVLNKTDDFLQSEPILLADYELSESELIVEESLRKVIFPKIDDDCEDCP